MNAPGFDKALSLFHEMAESVPAYSAFLKENRINPSTIIDETSFKQVPVINKENYLRRHSLQDLSWNGSLEKTSMISMSSGSSGDPFFWPHGEEQHLEGVQIHREILERIFETEHKRTLVVVSFSMGTWIAGPFTMLSAIGVSKYHSALNVVTPGIDKEDAVRAILGLESEYERIIICGYPPFAKDIYENLISKGFNPPEGKVSFVFAGESIDENWREFVLEEANISDMLHGSVNVYGSADATILGHETPLSIAIRRAISENDNRAIGSSLFGSNTLPSLVQYYPDMRYFEEVDGSLVFTSRSGIPLCRYEIGDQGKVFGFEKINTMLKENFIDPDYGSIKQLEHWKGLPLVSINGRKNQTISLYGLLIYPENIKSALIQPELRNKLTGKFRMRVENDEALKQVFTIDLELKDGVAKDSIGIESIKHSIMSKLEMVNSEYRKLRNSVGERAHPELNFFEYDHPDINNGKNKHRWNK